VFKSNDCCQSGGLRGLGSAVAIPPYLREADNLQWLSFQSAQLPHAFREACLHPSKEKRHGPRMAIGPQALTGRFSDDAAPSSLTNNNTRTRYSSAAACTKSLHVPCCSCRKALRAPGIDVILSFLIGQGSNSWLPVILMREVGVGEKSK
jgi:hypothetical protein